MEVKILQKNYDLIIRNGIVVFNDSVKKADIGVYDGKIVEINDEISGDANEIIDALGFHIFPATTDGHVHFNSPGRMDWETIKTGSKAIAAAGGTVSVSYTHLMEKSFLIHIPKLFGIVYLPMTLFEARR